MGARLSADYRADLDTGRDSFDGEVVATAVAVSSPDTLASKYSSSSTDAATTVIGGGGAPTAEAAPAAAVKPPRLRRATTPPNLTPRGRGRPALTFDEKLPKDQKEFFERDHHDSFYVGKKI